MSYVTQKLRRKIRKSIRKWQKQIEKKRNMKNFVEMEFGLHSAEMI